MFSRVLIANRGEIACRIMRTCRRLGVETVAIYSDADVSAMHVEMADQAVHIGGAAPSESYLQADRIVEAALQTGANAIHPGYGFLSENPEFVEKIEAAGLVFIGPSAQAIRAMGLKDAAKAVMAEAGVPVVPGYQGEDQSDDRLAAEARDIGYPVMIKAVAAGGGKGMRRVDDARDFAAALSGARAEARAAFGNEAVLLEKFVSNPRHIEFQIFGDGTRAVHLFERDCSLQRRHQKVIEEAPAPGMTQAMRAAMGSAAARAAEALGYRGAGTVEFIVDASQGLDPEKFWFMEMNTRLQVEHPVTEAVTGHDLVEWQLRVAAGGPLPAGQDGLALCGHAIEARLYAEDVPAGFLPATGTLTHLAFPPDARADSGVRAGDAVSPHYDPMIAKLIVHGATRGLALLQLKKALNATQIAGTVTNHTFLRRLAVHPDFVSGDVDTGLIDRHIEALSAPVYPCTRTRALAAVTALGLPKDGCTGFSLWHPLSWQVILREGDDPVRISVLSQAKFEAHVDDKTHLLEMRDGTWLIDGAKVPAAAVRQGNAVTVFFGNAYAFDVPDPLDRLEENKTAPNLLLAPMPGFVRRIDVKAGDHVHRGQRMATLEAMKMEHSLTATRDGVVAEVLAIPDAQVDVGAALIRLAEAEE